jgi:hypothetical protein
VLRVVEVAGSESGGEFFDWVAVSGVEPVAVEVGFGGGGDVAAGDVAAVAAGGELGYAVVGADECVETRRSQLRVAVGPNLRIGRSKKGS